MKKRRRSLFTARNVALTGILAAFVLLFQAGLGAVKIGATSFSLVLIPIVLGSCLVDPIAGGILGFEFSLIVFIYGVTGGDAFTFIMLDANPFATVLIIFAKGILAGFVPGVIYNALKGKNAKVGVITAALSAPLINTLIFVLLTLAFGNSFSAAFIEKGFIGDATALTYFVFIGCAGINFIVEFCVNVVATPLFFTVIGAVDKRITEKNNGEEK